MTSRTTPFVLGIAGSAIAIALLLPSPDPAAVRAQVSAVAVLASLTLISELLTFLLPKGALASVSSIPLLAAVLISPTWHVVAAIAVVKAIAESVRRAEFEKAVFNISQYALAIGLGAVVYRALDGTSLLAAPDLGIQAATAMYGVAAFAAFSTTTAVNTLTVSAVIAIATHSRLSSVWRAQNIAKIGVDILASPLIFLFTWAYVQFGPIVAAAVWAPIVGLRQVYKSHLELEQTNVELLDLMVKSIEARDPYTSGHSRRVQDYSMTIARSLNLPERDVQMVGRAALLHDVGKIHEKYGPILRKADRLSHEEWQTMREHPADGAGLIATMTRLRELVGPVRHHHENWDGTGYPDGLAGELIPLSARIIRFADTIDAMTTERPYRPPMTADEVRAEIIRCRGSQFDPHLVDRLLSNPAWKTMFASTSSSQGSRFGELSVLRTSDQRLQRA